MAIVQYFDALGAKQALDLVGGSGMLPLDALGGSFPNTSSTFQDDGTRIRQLIYSGGVAWINRRWLLAVGINRPV